MLSSHGTILIVGVILLVIFMIVILPPQKVSSTVMNEEVRTTLIEYGLDKKKVEILDGEWYVDGVSTHVCAREEGDVYLAGKCYGGGKTRVPSVKMQLQLVSEAIKNGGVHPLSPNVY